jgi:hypothetical protein
MIMKKWTFVLALSAVTAPAQFSLPTTLAGGNGQNGNMFDITNISASTVFITGFDQSFFSAGTAALYEVYTVTAGTTYVGNETNPGAWTLQGSTTGLAHPTALTAVPVPIVLSIPIAPGTTRGFYLTTNTDIVAYTNGASPAGTVFVADANIQFHIGIGKAYPFGAAFTPRVWNGVIYYTLGSPLPPLYETNSTGSSLDLNGVQGQAYFKAVSNVCTGGAVTVNSSGMSGLPFEAVFNTAPTVPVTSPFALTSSGGQILNLDISAGLTFFNGGPLPAFLPYFGPFSTTFSAPGAPITLSFQQLNTDPGNPEGFSLSQAPQLNVSAQSLPATPFPGPTGDDTEVQVGVGCISVYGRAFSQMFIESNGRLMFGGGNTSFTPTATAFRTDPASFGVWTDLNPAVFVGGTNGLITMNAPAPGVIDVSYVNVAYFATTIPNNFNLQIDTNTSILTILGLTGFGASTGQMLIGASGGSAVGATDPGVTNFSPGGTGTTGFTLNGTDMIYALGLQGSVTTGINRIDFILNGFNNYDWLSQ